MIALHASAPSLAGADPTADPRVEAQERYQRALKLFEIAGNDRPLLEGALAEFQAAYRLHPLAPILFNIGVLQRKLGLRGEALRTFERYLHDAGAELDPTRRKAVEEELAEIRRQVAEVVVRVEGGPAELWIDGRAIGRTPLADSLFLLPGIHTFRASREGAIAVEKQLEVLSGNRYEVELSPVAPPTRATLAIATRPVGARLLLDGELLGASPWRGEVEPGGHELVAEHDGYERSLTQLILGAGQTRELDLELVRPTPIYKKWWFWTAVGVVAAGAGASVYVATLPSVDHRVSFP